jgi:outer membrane immunogenic protein
MMRTAMAGLAFLALAAAPASAADLPRHSMPYKAPAYVPTAYNWTGFYLGLQGGGAWGDSRWSNFGISNSPSGGLFGVTAGYNWQGMGSPWVVGLEGDIAWTGIDGSTACPAATNCETRNNWLGTVRGRVGYSWNRFLPYVTGGMAVGDVEARRTGFAGSSDTNVGWTVGGGVEGVIAGRWTAKLEYLYADIGDTGCSAAGCGAATNADLQLSIFRGGVNYRF